MTTLATEAGVELTTEASVILDAGKAAAIRSVMDTFDESQWKAAAAILYARGFPAIES